MVIRFTDGSRTRPDPDLIWAWLKEVPDPEIPVVSVVDLGMIRDVVWDGDRLRVAVTPTYSGCPATSVITLDIRRALEARGLDDVAIEICRAPAWTTDWITPEGKEKLRAYGIAPPAQTAKCAGMLAQAEIRCPQCGSLQTEIVSEFGSTPCKASYRCLSCLEPFDYFKPF
ncbi:1,2-phenylacetyl-CoA epoxidase subunit PaaD [Hyphomonas sp.]|uniref:1,2-phenylacetyl-CoA epoxidase subunit PaaD n=1 Tax=Hyphomonas sp. TaxID=87 RepID=UPI0025B9776B|nr:1,2-phenylacetyl-CoA epoxidase subunit PaaD [Hyphomonas sp.]